MIPTDTPSSAAARAARWPASPAPITRTSWDGTGADAIAGNPEHVVGIRHFVIRHLQPAFAQPADGGVREGDRPLEGVEVDVLGGVVRPVVATRLLVVGAAAEGDGFVAGDPGLEGVGAVVGAEVGVEPDV